jgi:nucleoside-diphosphate-sugar epimerase
LIYSPPCKKLQSHVNLDANLGDLCAHHHHQTQMINPAVEGTLNVLKACSEAAVKRVVLTSSIGAVYIDPSRPATQIIDESCWSNETHVREIKVY